MTILSAIDISKVILTLIHTFQDKDPDKDFPPELVTRLKLLKLLYYVQGYHLAMFKQEVFKEEIQAWKHGPVVKEVYDWVKNKEDKDLNKELLSNKDLNSLNLHDQQLELITDVLKLYNKYSAYGLRDKTHKEEPWLLTYEEGKNNIITKESLTTFFTPLISR
ncbi:Panacea domain-containing protein [Campylobacter fetus]|uniref:Panacea domain-containing protein n=1 Tax=Campylobacter fetus TaxID=196 RepID=UPI0009BF62A0|nr:type II toxin-antitoxin system antitoxin SocA domain-containing protein [Campylobacter fetus]